MADEPVTIDMLLYKVLRSLDDSSRAIYRNVHIEGLQTVDMEDTWDRSRYQTGLSLTLPDGGRLLEHAIRNLLANALQYGINRQHINCACICLRHALADENRCLLIQVSDHGAGISLEHQKKIFQPFFRVPGIPRSRPASVGLGLALVESIADYYGGSVEVQSQPGQGSTFCLKIPVEIHR